MAPLKKLQKLVSNVSTHRVQEIVHQALISDKSARAALFAQLTNKGLDRDIVAAVFKVCSEQGSKVTLYMEDLQRLREYFVLLGAETALNLFEQYEKGVSEKIDEHSRNLVMILCWFLSTVNIIGYEKLRSAVKSTLFVTIEKLWTAGKQGEACYVARHFLYVLLAEESYLGVGGAAEVWNKNVTKSMRKSPNMACLSVLLAGPADWTEHSISTAALDALPADKDTEMCLRKQLCSLFLAHKGTFVYNLEAGLCQQLIKFVIKDYAGRNEVSLVVKSFMGSRELLFKQEQVWQHVFASMLLLIQDELEEMKSSKDVAVWIGSLAGFFTADSSESVSKPLRRLMDKFIQHDLVTGGKLKTMAAGHVTRAVGQALDGFPWELLAERERELCKPSLLILCTIFHSKEAKVFQNCLSTLARVIRLSPGLDLFGRQTAWLDTICNHWLPALQAVSDGATFRPAMVTVLANALSGLPEGFDGDLKYLQGDLNDSDSFSESRLTRLGAEFASSPWKHMAALSEAQSELIVQEIKANSLDRVLSGIEFSKNGENVEDMAEKWSFVFTIFDGMTRDERSKWVPLLLTEKQKKKLCKTAVHLLDGSYPLPTQPRNIVLRRAAKFFAEIVPSFELGSTGAVSKLLSWSSLTRIHEVEPQLLKTVVDRVPAEKITELFLELVDLLESESVPDISVLLLTAAEVMTPRLAPQMEQLVVPLASLLEAGSENSAVLSLAARCVRACAQTTSEKQLVNLCLTVASAIYIAPTDTQAMFYMDSLLFNALRYTHPSVNNDQCAVFVQLLVRHYRAVQRFVQYKNGSVIETDRLVYGCTRIAHQLTLHSLEYSRIIASLISETVVGYHHIELAMCKLHTMNDKFSSALLATALPPAEKRQYSRVFPDIRKKLKRVV